MATSIALSSAFYGSGNTWPPTITGLLSSWAIQIPATAIAVYLLGLGPNAMWIIMILANSVYLVVLLVWFMGGKWKYRKV